MKGFYHIFANGRKLKSFAISQADFTYQFNLAGISSIGLEIKILAFCIEDSHPHFLVYGEHDVCLAFMARYKLSTIRHIVKTRNDKDGAEFDFQMYHIEEQSYLANAASYVIAQPTKDGKKIMPYDYFWGTGSMYFRPTRHKSIWLFGENGESLSPVRYGDLCFADRRAICSDVTKVPEHWITCNGIILPENFIDVQLYESIFSNANRFRTFMAAGSKAFQEISDRMASESGVMLEDSEAQRICRQLCKECFGVETARTLTIPQRLELAKKLRRLYCMSWRQIAIESRLPEIEIRKFIQ